jgi:drug/metabolite transporter (DMT)-like permease
VTRVEGDEVVDTALFDSETITDAGEPAAQMFGRRRSDAVVSEDRVVTVMWPVSQLVIVGAGPVAEALGKAAALLGWQIQTTVDVATATGVIAGVASGAITSGIGYAIWYRALSGLSALQAATVQLTVPVIAALGGVAFLGERITLRLLGAGALVLGGIAVVIFSRSR